MYLGEKWGQHSLLLQLIPIYSLEERVIFHFIDAVCSQSILRFSLDQTIHKVNTLSTPSVWRYFVKLNLLG